MPSVSSKKIKDFKEGDIQPMLATLTNKPFDEPGWIIDLNKAEKRIQTTFKN